LRHILFLTHSPPVIAFSLKLGVNGNTFVKKG
jgi:hypothetical protein